MTDSRVNPPSLRDGRTHTHTDIGEHTRQNKINNRGRSIQVAVRGRGRGEVDEEFQFFFAVSAEFQVL